MIATAWAAGSPPAEGWMDVYSLVCVEGYSVTDAAAMLNLPPEKVRQARNQVITWLATNQPLHTEQSKEEALRLSEAMARERLEHLYCEAMEAWKNSQQEEVQTRQEGIMARTTRTIKSSHGKICYLNIAAKISEMLLKIPYRYVPSWMKAGSEAAAPIRFQLDAGERAARQKKTAREDLGTRDGENDLRSAHKAATPPVGDCSDGGGQFSGPAQKTGTGGGGKAMNREDAIALLSERLYEVMENLDPGDGRSWGDLSLRERDFYRIATTLMLEERELVSKALADDDDVSRRSEASKDSQSNAEQPIGVRPQGDTERRQV